MRTKESSFASNKRSARKRWGNVSAERWETLRQLINDHHLSVTSGDIILLDGRWYATHSGLLALARRKKCSGIHVEAVGKVCDLTASRFVLMATVYPAKTSAASLATAMLIRLTSPLSSVAPRCAWPKLELSTALCGRPMASGSALLRSWAGLPALPVPPGNKSSP